jgi:hypothetical protein
VDSSESEQKKLLHRSLHVPQSSTIGMPYGEFALPVRAAKGWKNVGLAVINCVVPMMKLLFLLGLNRYLVPVRE